MKIAVTGATGFIGRYVIQELGRRPDVQVVATARHSSQVPALPANCRYVPLDLAQSIPTNFDLIGAPDVLIHLAWGGLPNFRSIHHYETQLPEQYRFLAAMLEGGLRSLLCTGTCFEYGMRSGELSEELSSDPQNPYAFAKDALRRQLSFLRERNYFRFTWARLFYMYGEGQAPSSLYTQLMNAGRNGEASFRMSAGEQLRDFLPVSEIAAAIVNLAVQAPDAGIVNVCSGTPVTVRSMVERWLRENHWSMRLELGYYPYPDYEPMAFWGSNRRLTGLLGRAPAS